MPLFNPSPFGIQPVLLIPGQSGYSFGSFNDQVPDTKLFVTNSQVIGPEATITVQVWEGSAPSVLRGSPPVNELELISTQSLSNIPNVTNALIISTSFTDATNGTITYPVTGGTVASAPDAGLAIVPNLESGELIPSVLTGTKGAGAAFAVAALGQTNSRSLAWGVSFPGGGPTSSFEADLEGSIENVDSQFYKLDKITSVTGGTQTYTPVAQLNFLRIRIVTADNAGHGYVVAKIVI